MSSAVPPSGVLVAYDTDTAACIVKISRNQRTSASTYPNPAAAGRLCFFFLGDIGSKATFLSALYMAADPWLYLYYNGDGYNMCPRM